MSLTDRPPPPTPPAGARHAGNRFIQSLTGELHTFNVTFCYSLLNTVFSYDPRPGGGCPPAGPFGVEVKNK